MAPIGTSNKLKPLSKFPQTKPLPCSVLCVTLNKARTYNFKANLFMANITLSIDSAVIKVARKVAIDNCTTLTEMIRSYVKSLASRYENNVTLAINRVEDSFQKHSAPRSKRTWTRDDLYDR